MKLYLMRHGIAVAGDQPGMESDSARPLTPKGVKRMRREANGLRRLGISFDTILTSPLVRARQTADIVAETLGLKSRLEEISELAPETSVDHLVAGLARFHDREDLLLVGHNPLLIRAFSFFISGKDNLEIALKKGSLGCVETDGLPPGGPGTLHWLLTPKQLRRFAS
ncbi:MAG TPA: phosphohistidine phosphatase SixA [Candidatus Binatia bacterium]|nr:phosphohistidine phosphatase SixA [Candidatus Binatia bacterium]